MPSFVPSLVSILELINLENYEQERTPQYYLTRHNLTCFFLQLLKKKLTSTQKQIHVLAKLACVSKNEASQNKKIHYHCDRLENALKMEELKCKCS